MLQSLTHFSYLFFCTLTSHVSSASIIASVGLHVVIMRDIRTASMVPSAAPLALTCIKLLLSDLTLLVRS